MAKFNSFGQAAIAKFGKGGLGGPQEGIPKAPRGSSPKSSLGGEIRGARAGLANIGSPSGPPLILGAVKPLKTTGGGTGSTKLKGKVATSGVTSGDAPTIKPPKVL